MGIKAVKLKFSSQPKEFWSKIKKIEENGDEAEAEELFGNNVPQYIETEGVISRENGTVRIILDDSYLVGDVESKIIFSFEEENPNSVIMVRTVLGNCAYVFDDKMRRQPCSCNVGIYPFEITVCTEDICNKITYEKGGTMIVDYNIDINGIPADGSKLKLKVEPIKQ